MNDKPFAYVTCDLPEGMTLLEYRRAGVAARAKRRLRPWRAAADLLARRKAARP